MNTISTDEIAALAKALEGTGFPAEAAARWRDSYPEGASSLEADIERYASFWNQSGDLLQRLPRKPARSTSEASLAQALIRAARSTRDRFLRAHAPALYQRLTGGMRRALRVDELCYAAALLAPGLVPTRAQVDAEAAFPQRDKDGAEIDQGLLLAHVLADPACGCHLVQSMLLPRADALERAPEFARTGRLELPGASVERIGRAAHVMLHNPRFLNAEDDSTLAGFESAVDIALLDPDSQVCVLRGDRVEHPKYAGRRIFGAGINLTHIYQGKMPYLWYMIRDLGVVNKLYRGLGTPGSDEFSGDSIEKLWIAAVEAFAIGGHCQLLLTMDYILAASDAYMSLPARKEGIIPGAANLRLPRFIGDRLARQAVLYDRRFDCDSVEGRMICDRIVAPDEMDRVLDETVDGLTSSGVVSAAGNRRAFRIAQEPIDEFRRYMSVYAREQALCHFSPALIANLERHWDAKNRRG